MNIEFNEHSFNIGDTSEKFADLIKAQSDNGNTSPTIPFEDFTFPDEIVFGGGNEMEGYGFVRHADLFFGALSHFHGLEMESCTAVETPEAIPMTPYSMSLRVILKTIED